MFTFLKTKNNQQLKTRNLVFLQYKDPSYQCLIPVKKLSLGLLKYFLHSISEDILGGSVEDWRLQPLEKQRWILVKWHRAVPEACFCHANISTISPYSRLQHFRVLVQRKYSHFICLPSSYHNVTSDLKSQKIQAGFRWRVFSTKAEYIPLPLVVLILHHKLIFWWSESSNSVQSVVLHVNPKGTNSTLTHFYFLYQFDLDAFWHPHISSLCQTWAFLDF